MTGIALVGGGNVIGALRDRYVIAVATAATGGYHLVVIDRFKGQPRQWGIVMTGIAAVSS